MSKRILVVEDQEDNRRIMRDLLAASGYQWLEATNGDEGLATAEREVPDLILMDIQLPGLDGYEVTRRIKANPALTTRKRLQRGATATSPSPSARSSCWRRYGSI
jgi:two-component system, cell cycle response regulator DivK